MYDPSATLAILKTIAELFNRLRKRQKDKETFDIVRDLQAEQAKLEAQIKEAEAEVTRLGEQITKSNNDHAAEMTDLKKAHAAEMTQLDKSHAEAIARITGKPDLDQWGYGGGHESL